MRFLAGPGPSASARTALVHERSPWRHNWVALPILAIVSLLPGCATAPLVPGVGLSSYSGLAPSDGKITKSRLHVRKEQVMAARTVSYTHLTLPTILRV